MLMYKFPCDHLFMVWYWLSSTWDFSRENSVLRGKMGSCTVESGEGKKQFCLIRRLKLTAVPLNWNESWLARRRKKRDSDGTCTADPPLFICLSWELKMLLHLLDVSVSGITLVRVSARMQLRLMLWRFWVCSDLVLPFFLPNVCEYCRYHENCSLVMWCMSKVHFRNNFHSKFPSS